MTTKGNGRDMGRKPAPSGRNPGAKPKQPRPQGARPANRPAAANANAPRPAAKPRPPQNAPVKQQPAQRPPQQYQEIPDEQEFYAKKKRLWPKVLIACIIVVLLAGGGYFVYQNFFNTGAAEMQYDAVLDDGRIYKGVSVGGLSLGGMSKEDALNAIKGTESSAVDGISVKLDIEGKEFSISGQDVLTTFNSENVVETAYKIGREGSMPERKEKIDQAASDGLDIVNEMNIDASGLGTKIAEIAKEVNIDPKDATVAVNKEGEGDKFTYVDEVTGKKLNEEALLAAINEKLQKKDFSAPVSVQLEVSEPKIKKADLQANLVKRASFTSSFSSGTLGASNRVFNIVKIAGLINGSVVMPGEEFSVNKTVGPRTISGGWKEAPGITDGKYEPQAGGGVCQLSSTLFNAVLNANLKVTDRKPHSWPSSYIDEGFDATISTGGPDFKFVNDTEYPIFIFATASKSAKNLTVDIYGQSLGEGITIERVHKKLSTNKAPAPKTIVDKKQKPGYENKERGSRNGSTWESTVYYKKDGKVIDSMTRKWKTTYRTIQGIIVVGPEGTMEPTATATGTKKPNNSSTPDPDKTPDPNKTPKPTKEATPTPEATPKPTKKPTEAPTDGGSG